MRFRVVTFAMLGLILILGCASDEKTSRSRLTIEEAAPQIKPGMTVIEVRKIAQTTPILVEENRFQWRMKDGSIWTDFTKANREWKVTRINSKADSP